MSLEAFGGVLADLVLGNILFWLRTRGAWRQTPLAQHPDYWTFHLWVIVAWQGIFLLDKLLAALGEVPY